jgi:hypothetical protein
MAATPSAVTTTILQKIWLKECYRDAGSWSFRSIDRSEGKGFDGTAATMMHVVVQKHALRS